MREDRGILLYTHPKGKRNSYPLIEFTNGRVQVNQDTVEDHWNNLNLSYSPMELYEHIHDVTTELTRLFRSRFQPSTILDIEQRWLSFVSRKAFRRHKPENTPSADFSTERGIWLQARKVYSMKQFRRIYAHESGHAVDAIQGTMKNREKPMRDVMANLVAQRFGTRNGYKGAKYREAEEALRRFNESYRELPFLEQWSMLDNVRSIRELEVLLDPPRISRA
ncbi:MAG: hypothetical protein OXR66_03040 [Candidatus Woesearchaeota archaeon]|nr:hypothetical protein [Candidatus Woesearchaeota archaeon]